METGDTKDRPILFFIGVILLLVGLYGSFRTVVNLLVFEKYPQDSVFSFELDHNETYGPAQTEADCEASYYYQAPIYYSNDGSSVREATVPEKEADEAYKVQQEENEQNCIANVQIARKEVMVTDISQSAIFLLLALGVLVYGRVFRKGLLTFKI